MPKLVPHLGFRCLHSTGEFNIKMALDGVNCPLDALPFASHFANSPELSIQLEQ